MRCRAFLRTCICSINTVLTPYWHISPISAYPLFGSGKLLTIVQHILVIMHPFLSCGDTDIGT